MLLTAYALALFTSSSQTGLASITTPEVAQVVSWLPPDTETLVVAAEPGYTGATKEGSKLASDVRSLACMAFSNQEGDPLPLSYRFIVDGSKNYRFPKDLGIGTWEGCAIVALQDGQRATIEQRLKKSADHTAQLAGHFTYVFQTKETEYQASWKKYICFDGPYMICAVDKNSFLQVLDRKVHPHSDRALPDSLEEWKYPEAGTAFFAIRKFTAPYAQLNGITNMGDAKMDGLAVWLSKDRKALNVISIADGSQAFQGDKNFWQGFLKQEGWKHSVDVTAVDSRTTRIVLDAQGDHSERPLFILMAMLGHPIFV